MKTSTAMGSSVSPCRISTSASFHPASADGPAQVSPPVHATRRAGTPPATYRSLSGERLRPVPQLPDFLLLARAPPLSCAWLRGSCDPTGERRAASHPKGITRDSPCREKNRPADENVDIFMNPLIIEGVCHARGHDDWVGFGKERVPGSRH